LPKGHRRFNALREQAIRFRERLGELVAPLGVLMAELDEIESALDEADDRAE
jgi:hypothetical protein